MAVTVTIPLLLAFQKWRRKHHKNLELIVSKTPPTGQTGKLQLPQGHAVASTIPDLIEVGTTVILSPEPLARGNKYREISAQPRPHHPRTRRPKPRSTDSRRSSTKLKPSGLGTLKIVSQHSRMIQAPRNLKVVRQSAATQTRAGFWKATRRLEAESPAP